MSKAIQLDGGEGGGQMLRTALSLAMITGQPFRMTRIRGKRQRPGLMRQHLTCVNAACVISDGIADGAEIGSTELVFRAGKLRGGDHDFAIGTAGSTGLLFQTLLPALLMAEAPSTLRLSGGTHNPMAPPFEFLDRVFLPAIRRMGVETSIRLIESGFAPAGGGVIECDITPTGGFKPIKWMRCEGPASIRARVITRNLGTQIPQRILDAARETLTCEEALIENRNSGPGAGVCCLIEAERDGWIEMTSAFGEHGVSAERVGHRAGKAMKDFLGTETPVGRQLADQLLLPLSLAGAGAFATMSPDAHVPTNIVVIEKFLPVKIRIEDGARGTKIVRVS